MCIEGEIMRVWLDGWMDGETESLDEIGRMLEIG